MSAPRELDTYHRERRGTVEAFNRSHLGLGNPDAKANDLKHRFRSVSRRYERSLTLRRILRKTTRWSASALLLLVLLAAPIAIAAHHWSWPFVTTTRHFLAWPNCGAAREVGLALALGDRTFRPLNASTACGTAGRHPLFSSTTGEHEHNGECHA